jgi:cytochrome c peroxidase
MKRALMLGPVAALVVLAACGPAPEPPEIEVVVAEVAADDPAQSARTAARERAALIFGTLPDEVPNPDNPFSEAKIALGRMLYFDTRLSKNHDISCNSCHDLTRFGVDGEPTSPGHRGQRGDRNSPTVYNAALHIAQFWDGRAADVEEQAKGPVLNPVEMAMASEDATVAVLRSIPGYDPLFRAAFPDAEDPISYDNMARAIGAFERRLMTPSPFDAFLEAQDEALTDQEVAGLTLFMDVGCIACHNGPAFGGRAYQKLGGVSPYPTEDPGRFNVTGNESDRGVFKVPSLRNVAETGPYFHDGSVGRVEQAIRLMAKHQLGRTLSREELAALEAFLASLTGSVDTEYIAVPELPASGPETPAPDPT